MAMWNPRDSDLLLAHVTDEEAVSGYISTFVLAVREARVLTGRDAGSGGQTVPYEQVVTKWTGTVTYLILLEQVGKSLRPLGP